METMDFDKKTKRVRKKVVDPDVPDDMQLRLRLHRHTGKEGSAYFSSKERANIPFSTKICLFEISLISKVNYRKLRAFRLNKPTAWKMHNAEKKRIAAAIDLVESGRVTKTKHGVYTIHDEPVVEPVREMKLSMFGGKILQGAKTVTAEDKFPSKKKLFGI